MVPAGSPWGEEDQEVLLQHLRAHLFWGGKLISLFQKSISENPIFLAKLAMAGWGAELTQKRTKRNITTPPTREIIEPTSGCVELAFINASRVL